jgi:hypothetical protein
MKKLSKQLKWRILIGTVVVLGLLSVIFPIERTNPPVTGEIEAPEEVMAILHRSCFDCHSNETKWPWYSYVAPVSWLVAKDVRDGRGHINFSEWADYNSKQKEHKQEECGEMVAIGEMPLWFYVPLHLDSEMIPKDIEIILAWSKGTLHKE